MKLWWSCKFVPCGFCSLIHPTSPAISFTTSQLFLFRPIWSIWSICTLCRYVVRTVCYNECTANSRSHTLNISSSPREILMLSLSIQGFGCPNSQRLCCVPPMSRILCSDLGASIGNSTLQAGLPLSHIKRARSIRLWVCEMFLRTSSKLVHLVPSFRSLPLVVSGDLKSAGHIEFLNDLQRRSAKSIPVWDWNMHIEFWRQSGMTVRDCDKSNDCNLTLLRFVLIGAKHMDKGTIQRQSWTSRNFKISKIF